MSNFPAIPEPGPSINQLYDTVRALKMCIELLNGTLDKTSCGVPRVYVQRDTPVRPSKGDLWFNTDTNHFCCFDGRIWNKVI